MRPMRSGRRRRPELECSYIAVARRRRGTRVAALVDLVSSPERVDAIRGFYLIDCRAFGKQRDCRRCTPVILKQKRIQVWVCGRDTAGAPAGLKFDVSSRIEYAARLASHHLQDAVAQIEGQQTGPKAG